MTVVWREAARADIARVIGRIAEENAFAAHRIARELLLAGDSLTLFPKRGRLGRIPGTRELVALFPYVIVYEVEAADSVAILRVWHGAERRP